MLSHINPPGHGSSSNPPPSSFLKGRKVVINLRQRIQLLRRLQVQMRLAPIDFSKAIALRVDIFHSTTKSLKQLLIEIHNISPLAKQLVLGKLQIQTDAQRIARVGLRDELEDDGAGVAAERGGHVGRFELLLAELLDMLDACEQARNVPGLAEPGQHGRALARGVAVPLRVLRDDEAPGVVDADEVARAHGWGWWIGVALGAALVVVILMWIVDVNGSGDVSGVEAFMLETAEYSQLRYRFIDAQLPGANNFDSAVQLHSVKWR